MPPLKRSTSISEIAPVDGTKRIRLDPEVEATAEFMPNLAGASPALRPIDVSPALSAAGLTFAIPSAPTVPLEQERNPIAPCGSCTEWLKKVAAVNPDLKIITFTNEDCDYVYERSVPT